MLVLLPIHYKKNALVSNQRELIFKKYRYNEKK